MNKNLIQQNGLELSDIQAYILYEWATGTGKSLLGIKIIEKFEAKHKIMGVNSYWPVFVHNTRAVV